MNNAQEAETDRNSTIQSARPRLALLVSQYLGTNAHGAEAHTAASFIKMLRDDFEVDVVGGEVVPSEISENTHYVYFRYLNYPHLLRKVLHIPAAIINIVRYCHVKRPALILATTGPSYGGFAALVAKKLFNIPYVVRATEDYINHSRQTLGVWSTIRQYILGNIVSMYVLRRADMVLATGKRSREHFIKHGVVENKIVGIPGPIQRNRFWPNHNKKEVREALKLPNNKKIIMYVGGLQPFKGSEELIAIIEKVLAKSEDFLFVIVGKEVRGNRITQKLVKVGKDKLIMVPPQPHEKLVSYYQAADCLLFLTKVGVGYGQVNIEATLCNTPIVAWDPGLDVKEFLGPCCFNSVEKIVEKILSQNYQLATILPEQDDQYVSSEHIRVLKGLIK